MKPIFRKLLGYFLAGAFALLPLVITVAVVIWVAGLIGQIIGPGTLVGGELRRVGLHFVTNTTAAYLLGFAVALAAVFVFGVLVEMGAKQLYLRVIDWIVERIPLVSGIYGTSKQLVGMLDKQKGEADLQGMSVVFCLFGGPSGAGLLALLVSPQRFPINGRDYQIVIVPTASVPIGGALLFVPADTIVPANVSVDGLMSIYVSMGVTAPEFLQPAVSPAAGSQPTSTATSAADP